MARECEIILASIFTVQLVDNRFNNIHPGLSQEEALRILALPVDRLEASSDRYMAASHLINFPGTQSEQALLHLIADTDNTQATRLARRKAVEVLARLGCQEAMASIGKCLQSEDHYLVENAAWALLQLGCNDQLIIDHMITLLVDPAQNRRVLIQSLAGLGVARALPTIYPLQEESSPGVRGAAISAVSTLGGSSEKIGELAQHLFLPNQMDRQSAIQDIIDAGAGQLLPDVLRCPVSPVFRMRAVKNLQQQAEIHHTNFSLVDSLDRLLWDDPDRLQLVHQYDQTPEPSFLIDELFGTDFSRCYLALQTLFRCDGQMLWPLLEKRWHEEAHNDYGAHYFFMRLFGGVESWGVQRSNVIHLTEEAIFNRRPQFMKSRSAAILSLLRLQPERLQYLLAKLLNPAIESNWECRYATWIAYEELRQAQPALDNPELHQIVESYDPDPFVQLRKQRIVNIIR